MRRELITIGDMQTSRASRRYRVMRGMGAAQSNFLPPTPAQLDESPPGAALLIAYDDMITHFAASGVPSMHVRDPYVLAFQTAYDADPLSNLTGYKLDKDGGYGPASKSVADSFGSNPAPEVNTGTATLAPIDITGDVPAASHPAATTPTTPTKKTTTKAGLSTGTILLGVGAAALVAWLILRKKKRRGASRRRGSVLTLRTNPAQAGLR